MNCTDFFEEDLSGVIQRALDEPRFPLVFVHLPKTGGTSLQRDLNFAIPDGIHIPQREQERHWKDALGRLDPDPTNTNPPLLRGHLTCQHLDDLDAKGVSYRAFSYLRHPIERLVSQFLWSRAMYRRDPNSCRYVNSFEEYCEKTNLNYMSERLIGSVDSPEQAIECIKQRYWFIGVTEYYHICQSILFAALGVNYRIRKKHNQTRSFPEDEKEISSACLEQAKKEMNIDLAIYDYFHAKWSAKINEAFELLMTSR